MEDVPMSHNADATLEVQSNLDGERSRPAKKFQGSDHLHVDVQRRRSWSKRQGRKLRKQFLKCCQMCTKVSQRTLVVLRTWIRRKWHATLIHKPDVSWNRIAEQMMIKLAENGHLVFRGTSSVSRGTVKAKVAEKHGTYCACILPSARCLRSHCGLLAR